VIRQIELVSATRSTMSINRETGTGKGARCARAIDADEQLLERVAMLAEVSRPDVGVVSRSPNDAQPLTAPHDEALPETAPLSRPWLLNLLTSLSSDTPARRAFEDFEERRSLRFEAFLRIHAVSRYSAARRVPGRPRRVPFGWCSKLCSDRVGKRQIGTRRDGIAIGRFVAENRKIGCNS
jgi:hypothetical protein